MTDRPSLYPEDYRDPEYDGTVEDFAAKVIPARLAAIMPALNERFADVLPEGVRLAFDDQSLMAGFGPVPKAVRVSYSQVPREGSDGTQH